MECGAGSTYGNIKLKESETDVAESGKQTCLCYTEQLFPAGKFFLFAKEPVQSGNG